MGGGAEEQILPVLGAHGAFVKSSVFNLNALSHQPRVGAVELGSDLPYSVWEESPQLHYEPKQQRDSKELGPGSRPCGCSVSSASLDQSSGADGTDLMQGVCGVNPAALSVTGCGM